MKKNKKKPNRNKLENSTYMGIVMTTDIKDQIIVIAKDESRSLSNVIRMLLQEALYSRQNQA